MRHPIDSIGKQRICPETGGQFRECWTNHKKPELFNECEQCSPNHETIAQSLHRLNEEAKHEANH